MKKSLKIISILFFLLFVSACANKGNEVEINLEDTKEIEFHDLVLTIPKVYEKNNEITEHFQFYSIPEEKKDFYCTFELLEKKNYKEKYEEEIENELPKEYFESYEIKQDIINDQVWSYAEAKSKSKGGLYYLQGVYFTVYQDRGYTFEYTSYSPDKKSCDKLFKSIIKTLKFKNT